MIEAIQIFIIPKLLFIFAFKIEPFAGTNILISDKIYFGVIMALLPVTLIGDKILRKKANQVKKIDFKTIELIKNMFDTMRNANGVGLAANQVGSDKAIFVIDVSEVEGYENIKPIAFINPRITFRSKETELGEEGCLSIPDLRGDIERARTIKITYHDTDLVEHTFETEKFLARVIQHEYDHLQGVLFTDLVSDGEKKKLRKEILKIKKRDYDFNYPVTDDIDYQII